MFCAALLLCAVTGRADGQTTSEVRVWIDEDGSLWMGVDGLPSEVDAKRVTREIGAMIGLSGSTFDFNRDPDTDLWWVTAERTDFVTRQGWSTHGRLNVELLRESLVQCGVTEVDWDVYLPVTPQSAWSPALEFEDRDSDHSNFWGSQSTEDTWAPSAFVFGYTTAGGWARVGVPLTMSLVTILASWALARRMRARLDAGDDGAYFVSGQWYGAIMVVHWLSWIGVYFATEPVDALVFRFGWLAPYGDVLEILALPLLGMVGPVMGRQFLYSMYARYPGATWTRREFVAQSIYSNSIMAVVLTATTLGMNALFDEEPLVAAGYVIGGVFGFLYFYRLTLSAMGYRPQALDEGDLRERIDAMTEKAGLPPMIGVHIYHMTTFPMSNAFAANGRRVMLTDYLVNQLSKPEVDAVVAHELGHLKHGHPKKLMVLWLAFVLATATISMSFVFVQALVVAALGLEDAHLFSVPTLIYISVALPLLTAGIMAIRRRFEFTADAAGLELNGDAEGAITSLRKITRFNLTPDHMGAIGRFFATHPSTRTRCEILAQKGGIPPERFEALMGEESGAAPRYEIPHSSSVGRVFSSSHKQAVVRKILLATLLTTVSIPIAVAYAQSLVAPNASPLLWAAGAAVGITLVLALLNNFFALLGFRSLRRQLAVTALREGEAADGFTFVTFCPNGDMQLYEGFSNWDIGFVRCKGDDLEYRGEAVRFALSKRAITGIELVRFSGGWISEHRIAVDWVDGEDTPRRFLFGCAEESSLSRANRLAGSFEAELRAWLLSADGEGDSVSDLKAPPALEAKGVPFAQAVSPRGILKLTVFFGVVAAIVARVATLLNEDAITAEPFYAGVAAGVGYLLYTLPWIAGAKRGEPPGTADPTKT